MSSFLNKINLHNVKKAVASTTAPAEHPTEQADPAFEAALGEFNAYHEHIATLDNLLSSYAKHYYELFSSSNDIIIAMSGAISNNDSSDLRTTFATTRQQHATLTGEREAQLSNQMREDCIKPINDEMALHARIQATIQRRHELARELDYYSSKLDGLLREKQEKESKGKTVDAEKVERNQKKKDEAVSVYTTVNKEVIAQMHDAIANKGELLMRVWNAFESVEAQVADMYLAAVTGTSRAAERSTAAASSKASRSAYGRTSPAPTGVTVSLGMEGSDGQVRTLAIQTPPPSYNQVTNVAKALSGSPQPRSPQPPKNPPPPPKHV